MKLLLLLVLGCALVVTTIGESKESTDGGAQTAELVEGGNIEKTAANQGNRRPCKRASCFSALARPARTRRESELEIENVGKISTRRKPCRSGCYSPISVLEQKGSMKTVFEKIRTRRQSKNKGSTKRLKFNPKRCPGCFSAVTGISDLLGNGRRDRRNKRETVVTQGKRKPPRKCTGCYSAMARPPRERRDMSEADTPKRHRHGKRGRKEKNYPDDPSHAEHDFEDMTKSESQWRHRNGKKGRKEKKGHSEDRHSRRKHESKDETTLTAMKRKKHHKGEREKFRGKQRTGGFSAFGIMPSRHQVQAPEEKAVVLADRMTVDTRSE